MENAPDPFQGLEGLATAIRDEPDGWALFLDIDGTLIDLADTPDAIIVPPALPGHLNAISERLGGALALVTGRALPYADRLFQPYRFPIAGLHGSERRAADGTIQRLAATAAFDEVKQSLQAASGEWPGVLIEDKGAAIAAHYRQAPEWRDTVEKAMEFYLLQAGTDFTLQRGKMVFEIRPARADKGEAVRAYLDEPPFRGRRPITIGDDITDEAMFRTANSLGGRSIRISETAGGTEARTTIASTSLLRETLSRLATHPDTPENPKGSTA